MFRKTLAVLVAAFLALSPSPVSAAAGETVFFLENSDGTPISDVYLQVRTQDGRTNLRLKTDTSGKVAFPAIQGPGTLEASNCVQSATSFSIQIYNANFGDGSRTFTLRLPSRQKFIEYEFKSPDGLIIPEAESLGRGSSPSVNSSIRDMGSISTEVGNASISSCGKTWFTKESHRIAPFFTSTNTPEIFVIENIEGGTVTRTFPTTEFNEGQKKTITLSTFKYLSVTTFPKKIYERQLFKITAEMKGIKEQSLLDQQVIFVFSCATGGGFYSKGATLDGQSSVSLTASVTYAGKKRCGLVSFGQGSSFGVDLEILPIKAFNVAASKKYKSCSLLNAAFDGGLAKSTAAQNSNPNAKYLPSLSVPGYKLNAGLDRDKDGIACEQ